MWNAEIKRDDSHIAPFFLGRRFIIGVGIASIAISVIVLGLSLFEAFLGGGKIRMVELPGFHELQLETPGVYAGVYQHRGSGPLPAKELLQMDVRVMSKDNYEEVPVLMNSAGQTFDRFGMRGLPLFNFAISNPGAYTLSGVYTGANGPTVNILLIPQSAGNIKQTLVVGVSFFLFFLALGVFLIARLEHWAPKKKVIPA